MQAVRKKLTIENSGGWEERSEIRLRDVPRSSTRPTVPIGPPVTMVVPEPDIVAQVDLVAESFAALLAPPPPFAPPRVPSIPVQVQAPPAPPKRGRSAPIAAVVAIGLAGLAVLGVTTDLGQRLDRGLHNMYAIHVAHSFRVNDESPEPEHSLHDALDVPAAPVQVDSAEF